MNLKLLLGEKSYKCGFQEGSNPHQFLPAFVHLPVVCSFFPRVYNCYRQEIVQKFHSSITVFYNFHVFFFCVMVWIISSHIFFHALNFFLALFQWLFNLPIEFLISMTVFFIYKNSIFFTLVFFPKGLVAFFNSFLNTSSFQTYLFYNLYLGTVIICIFWKMKSSYVFG